VYDLFVGDLRCPNCGALSSNGDHTAMQTHIRVDADGSALGVGYNFDPFDLNSEKILRSGYLLVSPPEPNKPIRLLDTWACPKCETEQWGMITIDGGRLQLIEAVELDRASLQLANFISDFNAENVASQFPASDAGVVETLRRNLK
jgi:rubredoxin